MLCFNGMMMLCEERFMLVLQWDLRRFEHVSTDSEPNYLFSVDACMVIIALFGNGKL